MCNPTISGCLWVLNPMETIPWSMELDEQRELGFDMLWISNTLAMLDMPGDPLGKILDLCAEHKMQAILDTGYTDKWYDPLDINHELDVCLKHIKSIGERYAGHSAFNYWYIPHEIYMCWGAFADYIDVLYPSLVESCKNAAALPVTVSPFFILDKDKVFGDFRYAEPDEYMDYWERLIKKSAIDVVMLQDSGEHFSFCTNEQRRPFFEAMQAACHRSCAKMWGNVETAEYVCRSMEDYIRLYGRIHHSEAKGIPWRAVPADRLKDKLELAAAYSERIVCWGYREYCRPTIGTEAKDWYEDYKDYYKRLQHVKQVDTNVDI